MERVFEKQTYTQAFRLAVKEILDRGNEVRPRGMLTKEISPATIVIDPLHSIYPSPKRNLNFAFLLAENLWYLAGRADTFLLSYYNSNIKSFAEDGLHQGAYGPKIVSQLRYVIETLKNDPDSRQAIMTIWERNPRTSKDIPCTSLFQAMIRDGKLNFYVTMRSNDAIFGSNYDVPSFALLQIVIASCLGLKPGILYHTANSLHLYEQHFELAKELYDEKLPTILTAGLGELITPTISSLEEHIRQIDLLVAIESSMRHFKVPMSHFEGLDPFYLQYALVFGMYSAIKQKDEKRRDMFIHNLRDLGSPFGKIYVLRYGLSTIRTTTYP